MLDDTVKKKRILVCRSFSVYLGDDWTICRQLVTRAVI